MPKALKFPTKLLIGFTDGQISSLDDWRREQPDIPSRSEAVRRLVDMAMCETRIPRIEGAAGEFLKAFDEGARPMSEILAEQRNHSRPKPKSGR